MFGGTEAESLKEGRDAGKKTDASDAILLCLLEERLNEKTARSTASYNRTDNYGAYLGEVQPVDVQRGTAEELSVFGFGHSEGVDVLANLRVRAREKGAIVGVAVDEQMDGFGITQLGLARLQWRGTLVRTDIACFELGMPL